MQAKEMAAKRRSRNPSLKAEVQTAAMFEAVVSVLHHHDHLLPAEATKETIWSNSSEFSGLCSSEEQEQEEEDGGQQSRLSRGKRSHDMKCRQRKKQFGAAPPSSQASATMRMRRRLAASRADCHEKKEAMT
ncbi:hypothetical protein Q3G72_004334 [Acer saccharum]|nr:hypothetical protein Q3G72_004334 [Acer saccharum]